MCGYLVVGSGPVSLHMMDGHTAFLEEQLDSVPDGQVHWVFEQLLPYAICCGGGHHHGGQHQRKDIVAVGSGLAGRQSRAPLAFAGLAARQRRAC